MSIFNRLLPLLWGLFFLTSGALAQINQPTPVRKVFIDPPQKILQKAKGTRYNYSDAISEIRNGELELAATVEEVYGYILILDGLKAIEVSLDFPVWGVSPVKELGFYLTKIVSRKVDLSTISSDVLTSILRWSDDENTFTIIENQTNKFVQQDYPQEICLTVFKHATAMLDLETTLKAPLMLIGAIENFQRTVFLRLLKTYKLTISPEQLYSYLHDLRSVDALMDTLKYFLYVAYDLKDPQDYLKVFNYVVVVAKVNEENFSQPLYDFDNSYGEIISSMIVKMIESGLYLENGNLNDYKKLLKTKDIESISIQLLNFPVNQYKTAQLPFIAELTKMAIEYKISVNHYVDAKNLKLIYQEILLGQEIQKKNMEGFYEVNMDGMKSTLTVLQASSTTLAANLSMSDGYSIDNFAFSRLIPETNEIEFIKVERDMTGTSVSDDLLNKLTLKFEGNTVVGTYGNTENTYKINGKRMTSFEKPENLLLNPADLPGKYKSQIGQYNVQLNIKELKSGVYSATLNFTIEGIATPMLAATFEEYINLSAKNLAYFTDLRVPADEKIKQLRIFINKEGKLTTQYIISGSKEVKTFILQKYK